MYDVLRLDACQIAILGDIFKECCEKCGVFWDALKVGELIISRLRYGWKCLTHVLASITPKTTPNLMEVHFVVTFCSPSCQHELRCELANGLWDKILLLPFAPTLLFAIWLFFLLLELLLHGMSCTLLSVWVCWNKKYEGPRESEVKRMY